MAQETASRPRRRLLVVEDDPSIRSLLESALRLAGHAVSSTDTGRSALMEIERLAPALVLLDVLLPDLNGFEVTRRLRAAGDDTPVLFLSAAADLADRIAGLSAGGDDFLGKPFSIEEVLLRIEAILRRTAAGAGPAAAPRVLRYADLELDEDAHEVSLAYLLANPHRVLSKAQILDHVWGYDFAGDSRIIETYVKYLRRKVDCSGPPLIHTVRGVGYCLRLPREEAGNRSA
jgi:two-component system OmpR family response regulator